MTALASPDLMMDLRVAEISKMLEDVKARLAVYTPSLQMDSSKAAVAIREMSAWANDYGPKVAAMKDPSAPIPIEMRPALPADQARSWVAAVFFDAEHGFHFYRNGAVKREIQEGRMTYAEADLDLNERKKSLQLLVSLDEDGAIKRIFTAPLGLAPLTIGAIVTVVVALIVTSGVVLYQYYGSKESRSQTWQRFDEFCKDAKEHKDINKEAAEAYKMCVSSVQPPPAAKDPIETAIYVLGGVLAVYVLGYYVVPKLIAQRGIS